MGLDCWAMRGPDERLTPADVEAFAAARIVLCECDGDTSFRGKVYQLLLLEVTGVGLGYDRWVSPPVVRRMAADLEACDPVAVTVDERVTPYEVLELRRFFRLCAERDLGIMGG